MKYYCEKCNKRTESSLSNKEVDMPVKGDPIKVVSMLRSCKVCGEEVYDEALEEELFQKAFAEYRSRHNIISPDEIFDLREKYGLSQRSLAALLGWGEITIHRYEKGSLPDNAHNQTLQFISDPANMLQIYEQNKELLKPLQQKKIESKLSEMTGILFKRKYDLISAQEQYDASIYTGYKKFSEEIFENMVLFFAQTGVLITKLNKLLWYADFLHFKLHSISMSGTTYVPLPQGPVPDNYREYFLAMEQNKDISSEEIYEHGYTGNQITSLSQFNPSKLPETALPVLKAVMKHFKEFTSNRISEISHLEPGYLKTEKCKPISYEFANVLKEKITL